MFIIKRVNSNTSKNAINFLFSNFKRTFLNTTFPELSQLPKSIDSYEKLHDYSINNSEEFWSIVAKNRLEWHKPFDQTLSGRFDDKDFHLKWFVNGKLNVSVNCVDRHYRKNPNKVALIWEKDEPATEEYITYEQLYKQMNQIANMLRAYGVKKGDRVALYMPASPIAVATMLACTRIGALHSVVFAGFSADALAARINDSQCSVLITANQAIRGGKIIELKKTADEAVKKCPSIKNVFVMNRTNNDCKMGKLDIKFENEIVKYPTECEPEIMDSEDYLFMLYTSGSTGSPKGLVHTQAGYLTYVSLTHQLVFDYQPNDVFCCVADIGWITGHSYVVYGPLSNGGTTVLFESTPTYPDPGRYWEMVQRLKVNQFYAAPTALRFLLRYEDEYVKKYDRSTLKLLGSVGEPINHEAWHWYHDLVGEKRCKIVDTWWQTETGGICITPLPSAKDAVIKPAIAMRPFFGINPVLLNDKGHELPNRNAFGNLCIRQPWPAMARTIYGDHNRFLQTYMKVYPGFYYCGDGAHVDQDGHYQITGRVDDVINVSGHRIGTAEIEDVLDEHHGVAESAVVGFPHDITGEGIYAFVTLKEHVKQSNDEIIKELKGLIKKKIAAYAIPENFLITPNLPKTRSGKIMRRILRKIAANKPEELGDTSTLSDPSIVQQIVDLHNKKTKK